MVSVISERTFPKGVNSGCLVGCSVLVVWCPTGFRPLGIIARRYGVGYHFYADDTQLYVSLNLGNESNFSSSLENLEHCIADIRLWMTQNRLKSDDKHILSIWLHHIMSNP